MDRRLSGTGEYLWSFSSVKPTGGRRVALLCEARQMKYVSWPKDIEVRVYEITTVNAEKVAKSMKAGTVDCVVVAQKVPNPHITRSLPRDVVPVWVWIKNIHSLKDHLREMLGLVAEIKPQPTPPREIPAAALIAAVEAEQGEPQGDLADKPIYRFRDLLSDLIPCTEYELQAAVEVFLGAEPAPERLYSFNEAAEIETLIMERRSQQPTLPATHGATVVETRYCASSGERVPLTKDEVKNRAKACPRCGKLMRVRPSEGYATLPRHLRPELAHVPAPVPFATTVRVDETVTALSPPSPPLPSFHGGRLIVAGVPLPPDTQPTHYRGVSAAFIDVTPEMADIWRQRSTTNRNKREAHVEKLVRAMQAGEWLLTHQGVAFSTDGVCIDGQHRLDAVVRYGHAVGMMVTWGLEPAVIHVTDTGITRPVSDVLAIMGEPSARTKSAIFRAFARLVGAPDHKWSVQENMRFLDYARESVDWAMEAFSGHRKGTFKAPVIVPCMLLRASHPEVVEHFVAKLVGREEAMTSDPAIKLKLVLQQRTGDGQRMDIARYVLAALNATISGQEVKMLRPFSLRAARDRWLKGWEDKYGKWPFGFSSSVETEAEE